MTVSLNERILYPQLFYVQIILYYIAGSASQFFDNLKKRFSKKKHVLLRAWKNFGEESNEAIAAAAALREYDFFTWIRPYLRNKRSKWEIEENYVECEDCDDAGRNGDEDNLSGGDLFVVDDEEAPAAGTEGEGGEGNSFQYLRLEYAIMDDDDDEDNDVDSNHATEIEENHNGSNGSTATSTIISNNNNNKDGSEEVTAIYQNDEAETKSPTNTNTIDCKDTTITTTTTPTTTTTTLKFPALEKDIGMPTFVMSDIRSLKRKPSLPLNKTTTGSTTPNSLADERPPAKQAMLNHPVQSSPTMAVAPKRTTFCHQQANNDNSSRVFITKSNNTLKCSSISNKKNEIQNRTLLKNTGSASANSISSHTSQQQQQQNSDNSSINNNIKNNRETKFGEMMVHELEKLPAILRIQAKNEIANVLFRYQLQHETQNMDTQQ